MKRRLGAVAAALAVAAASQSGSVKPFSAASTRTSAARQTSSANKLTKDGAAPQPGRRGSTRRAAPNAVLPAAMQLVGGGRGGVAVAAAQSRTLPVHARRRQQAALRLWGIVLELVRFLTQLVTLRRVRMHYRPPAAVNIGKRVPLRYRGQLQALRRQVKAHPGLEARARAVRHELTEPTLSRYLEAAYWSLECGGQPVLSHLMDTIAWRESFGAHRIGAAEALAADGGAGVFFVRGKDRLGRPIVVVNPAKLPPGQSAAATMKALIYTLERATKAMPPGVEEITFVVDCRGFGLGRLPPVGFLRGAFACLMAHYPMRIGVIVMANAGTSVQLVWRVISPLVTDRTKRKMRFVAGGSGADGEVRAPAGLTKVIAPEQLIRDLGGRDAWSFDKTYFR